MIGLLLWLGQSLIDWLIIMNESITDWLAFYYDWVNHWLIDLLLTESITELIDLLLWLSQSLIDWLIIMTESIFNRLTFETHSSTHGFSVWRLNGWLNALYNVKWLYHDETFPLDLNNIYTKRACLRFVTVSTYQTMSPLSCGNQCSKTLAPRAGAP